MRAERDGTGRPFPDAVQLAETQPRGVESLVYRVQLVGEKGGGLAPRARLSTRAVEANSACPAIGARRPTIAPAQSMSSTSTSVP